MIRRPLISAFAYVLVILILIALWINPILVWRDYFEYPQVSFNSVFAPKSFFAWSFDHFRDGYSIVLHVLSYDIMTGEVKFTLDIYGPLSLPKNFIKYKPKVTITHLPRSSNETEILDWFEPGEKIIDKRPLTIAGFSSGYFPFDYATVTLIIEIETDFLKMDGTVEKDQLPIDVMKMEVFETRYNIRHDILEIHNNTPERSLALLDFQFTERIFSQVIFIAFFLLINVLIILILGINELSNLLQSVTAVVIGLWAMQNIILPDSIPVEMRLLAERSIVNTYLLIVVIVLIWLMKKGISNNSEKSHGMNRTIGVYRVRKNNIKRRIIANGSKREPTQFSLQKRIPRARQPTSRTKGKKYKSK